jgi:hypothetical protein
LPLQTTASLRAQLQQASSAAQPPLPPVYTGGGNGVCVGGGTSSSCPPSITRTFDDLTLNSLAGTVTISTAVSMSLRAVLCYALFSCSAVGTSLVLVADCNLCIVTPPAHTSLPHTHTVSPIHPSINLIDQPINQLTNHHTAHRSPFCARPAALWTSARCETSCAT